MGTGGSGRSGGFPGLTVFTWRLTPLVAPDCSPQGHFPSGFHCMDHVISNRCLPGVSDHLNDGSQLEGWWKPKVPGGSGLTI